MPDKTEPGLVERLRGEPDFMPWPERLLDEAASAIERLRAELDAVVNFALKIEDHYERLEFLKDWQDGSTETLPDWSDWRNYRRARNVEKPDE